VSRAAANSKPRKEIIMGMVKPGVVAVILAAGLWTISGASHGKVMPVARANVVEGCSVATLRGNYGGAWSGLLFSGSTPPASPQLITAFQPYDALEVSKFDGMGNFSSTVTANAGGTPSQSFPDSGTYQVNKDCTGSLTLVSGLTFDFIILRGGTEVRFAETDGNIAAITETRVEDE
jgi:hypothetical protein